MTNTRKCSPLGENFVLSDELACSFEQFVCKLYGQEEENVNEACYCCFRVKAACEQSSKTSNSLMLHLKCPNFQAAINHCSLQQVIKAPSPTGYGGCSDGAGLVVQWMTNDPILQALLQHLHCNCKQNPCNSKRCSCHAADLYWNLLLYSLWKQNSQHQKSLFWMTWMKVALMMIKSSSSNQYFSIERCKLTVICVVAMWSVPYYCVIGQTWKSIESW